MVMSGKINKEIVTTLQRVGIPAVGLSGVDGGLIRAERKKRLIIVDERGRKRIIDGGYTGKIKYVDAALLNLLLRNYLPVISPVALGDEYELLNVDGDRAAAYVAGSVKADKVIFLTDVQGLILDGRLVEKISAAEAKNLLPKIGFGMEKKVLAAVEAVEMGVKESVIASGLSESPISTALKGEGCTVIYGG
jgi:acetylglutamate/LysW-gamma-L-alpha-aminoadipate kinase